METIKLDDVIGFRVPRIDKSLRYENNATAYLVFVALKQQGESHCTSPLLSKLMSINYSYAWQLLNVFETMGLLRKLPGKKPKKFVFEDSLENELYIKIAKETLAIRKEER